LYEKGILVRQSLFLHALISKSFRVSQAMRITGTSYGDLKLWRSDPRFTELMDQISFEKKSFVEGKLMEQVEAGEPWAITLAIKALGGDEYSNRTTIKHEGEVSHSHSVSIEQLSLPLRKAVMAELEAKETITDAEVLSERKMLT
jgi:hypothetical protein